MNNGPHLPCLIHEITAQVVLSQCNPVTHFNCTHWMQSVLAQQVDLCRPTYAADIEFSESRCLLLKIQTPTVFPLMLATRTRIGIKSRFQELLRMPQIYWCKNVDSSPTSLTHFAYFRLESRWVLKITRRLTFKKKIFNLGWMFLHLLSLSNKLTYFDCIFSRCNAWPIIQLGHIQSTPISTCSQLKWSTGFAIHLSIAKSNSMPHSCINCQYQNTQFTARITAMVLLIAAIALIFNNTRTSTQPPKQLRGVCSTNDILLFRFVACYFMTTRKIKMWTTCDLQCFLLPIHKDAAGDAVE